MWVGIATSRAGDAAGGQLLVPVLHLLPEEWKLQVQLLQAPEGVVWRRWPLGYGKFFFQCGLDGGYRGM